MLPSLLPPHVCNWTYQKLVKVNMALFEGFVHVVCVRVLDLQVVGGGGTRVPRATRGMRRVACWHRQRRAQDASCTTTRSQAPSLLGECTSSIPARSTRALIRARACIWRSGVDWAGRCACQGYT